MEIILTGIAKSFGREAVFTGVDLRIAAGSRTAILGANGSGKSTLLQLVAGAGTPTAGTIAHRLGGRPLAPALLYRHVSIAAPYLELYEELALRETIVFHARFKPLRGAPSADEVARAARLEPHLEKPVAHFSSGMKQRLKLALAILSDTPLLLLDEPGSNLDADGLQWYRDLLRAHIAGRTLLVASNRRTEEHDLCTEAIEVERFKGA
ncbi:MAG: ABC transporter ATP-binding protein [Flavobacteriales bacterium]|jgi:ABC-type multidrug transport system ATPase subunit|nr:ABC transporter ATP-binding protein [Flavobacteriales bacterium]